VAGRALAFSDKEVLRMASEEFVPVAGDDWYQRRREDAEGAFFRKVADQGPRKGQGGSTRQGIYCLTASGKLLAYKNHQDPEVMRDVLRRALEEWKKLPAEERGPGAVKVADADKIDPHYTRTPPEGGLVLNVYTRILARDGKDGWTKGTCERPGGDQAARDHLWLTRAEWQSLIPDKATRGDEFPVPAAVASRLVRFHLIDNTRGEPPMWTREQVRILKLTLTVEEADEKRLLLRLRGAVLLATAADANKADRGFDAQLSGQVGYDRAKKAIDRFDVVALGDYWGDSEFTRGARPGKQPLGVVFDLTSGEKAADRVPPQGARDIQNYLGTGR
jgi:hypothetical protein